jgi:ABC-type multidrug transport system ATPase subunit
MIKNILLVDSVIKQYNHKTVLSDVYLKCETGNIIGLVGKNGSGKSTLLKILFGIIPADNKFVKINDKVCSNILFKEISYLGQDNFIPQNFTVRKALSLSIDAKKIKIFLDDPIFKPLLNNKIYELSGGEQRYLEIVLVLENNSKFVFLDEPYNGLSPVMVDTINLLIEKMSKEKGIIITDHNYQKIIKIATSLLLLKDGKAHHLNNAAELVEKGYLLPGMI